MIGNQLPFFVFNWQRFHSICKFDIEAVFTFTSENMKTGLLFIVQEVTGPTTFVDLECVVNVRWE